MVKSGARRKAGRRQPNGRLTQKPRAAIERGVMDTVLRQRGGETSQLAENPIGRFVLRHRLAHELHDAAWTYWRKRNSWRIAKGIAGAVSAPGDGGDPPTPEAIAACRVTIERCERAMIRASREGFDVIEAMFATNQDAQPGLAICDVIKALWACSQELGTYLGAMPFDFRVAKKPDNLKALDRRKNVG